MIQTYHHGRFEFFVAVIVIAIIALAALGRYSLMAEDARVLRLEIISNHFMTGAANARIQYLVTNIVDKKSEQEPLARSGQPLHFSEQGWPVSVTGPVADDYQVTDEDCYQLWQQLLQNPAPIAKGEAVKSRWDYRVFANANSCRYEFTDGSAYFDYYPFDGRLMFIPTGH
ncbi:hypothetical protein [Cellvibrio fibrivorans]|uniref:MSHA biogenesis protein MshF n=1 Tax=Cellvibrio fibrivorans TaxID=126350 RepID=A0ABU1UYF4_9GAMM|nr:hypothetical protein [Cellvibrio fibrivorans]MDR7090142.1 hypothetical protein [Cellvibrio fibrivorans]